MRAQEFVHEVNAPDELTIPESLIERFTSAGWQIYGEGRDQLVMGKPGARYVLKIVGSGSGSRQQSIREYVQFFRQHQRNPHFPKILSEKEFVWEGQRYYAYTQEMLQSLPGDEAVLDYLEYAMGELSYDQEPDFNRIPPGLSVEQIEGLIVSVDELFGSGMEPSGFDLGNVANIMVRPSTGKLVIVDPFSDFAELSESADPQSRRTAELLVRELEAELAELYDASRGTTPEPYKNQVRQRVRALNQELQDLGFKYAPTAPGKVAAMGTPFVEAQHSGGWESMTFACVNPKFSGGEDPDLQAMMYRGLKNIAGVVAKIKEDNVLALYQTREQRRAIAALAYRLGVKITQDEPISDNDAQQIIGENFADGKVKGKSRPGRVKRSGASCKGSVTDLRAKAKKYGGERGKMYHWCANMKSGKKK